MKTIRFTLPECAVHARMLGYAYGFFMGIATPGKAPDEPICPFFLPGVDIVTNDEEQFTLLFWRGAEAGLLFGRQASSDLADVLVDFPDHLWWPICIYFASKHMQTKEEREVHPEAEQIQQAVQALDKIYMKRHGELN